MPKFPNDTLNFEGLNKMQKILKGKLPTARVGILGSSSRSDGTSNAEVGAAHEFGTSKMPRRSFLREPIELYLTKELEKRGAFDDAVMKTVVQTRSVRIWLQMIAVVAKDVVLGAFDSAGYGRWKSWSAGYHNNTGNILVNTQQLRNSITEDVVD